MISIVGFFRQPTFKRLHTNQTTIFIDYIFFFLSSSLLSFYLFSAASFSIHLSSVSLFDSSLVGCIPVSVPMCKSHHISMTVYGQWWWPVLFISFIWIYSTYHKFVKYYTVFDRPSLTKMPYLFSAPLRSVPFPLSLCPLSVLSFFLFFSISVFVFSIISSIQFNSIRLVTAQNLWIYDIYINRSR